MKKMTLVACAAMLTSAAALTSCKNDVKNEPQGPAEVVKTEFAISLPQQAVGGPNKMPAATVQTEGITNFQGITDIFLVPFAGTGEIAGADTRLGSNIHLSAVAKNDIQDKDSKAKVYSNVSIPLTTASFLFYGQSAATGSKFAVGSLNPVDTATANKPEDFRFNLEQIYTTAGVGAKGDSLIAYLNSIANATDGSKAWKNYSTSDNAGMAALFATFSSIHGLSSFEVGRVVNDVYNTLNLMPESTLRNNIMAAIYNTTDKYIASRSGAGTVENPYVLTLHANVSGFPQNLNLPSGAVRINYSGGAFAHCTDIQYTTANQTPLALYTYPSSLWYYVNSPIKTANTTMAALEATDKNWAAVIGAYTAAGAPDAVNTQTRSVAITNPIQYAVARLDVQVRLKTSSLEDNSEAAVGVATAVNSGTGFPVTAILVGGQKSVGFDFTPVGTVEYTIYDSVMANAGMKAAYSTSEYSAMNHTLVLENGNEDVMVAIEMTNTSGVDFYGYQKQLIPKGGKFYVVAKLEALAASETGKTINTPDKVFKQDYTTTAKLTLKDLKSAYNTIPDLRTPQLELGFSVDLSWQTGNIYEIEF